MLASLAKTQVLRPVPLHYCVVFDLALLLLEVALKVWLTRYVGVHTSRGSFACTLPFPPGSIKRSHDGV